MAFGRAACYAASAPARRGKPPFRKPHEPFAGNPDSRVALVTGASRGIGRAVALALAASGAHVVALARTQGALEELDDAIRALRPGMRKSRDAWFPAIFAITRRSIGWARPSTVAGAVSTSSSATPGALGPLSPLHHVDPEQWDDVFSLNVTANWRLIRALDPLLRQSPAGRVVFVTSAAASRAELRAYWGPYAVSKAALDALARTYAAETVNTSPIRVMLVNPGPLRTRMRAARCRAKTLRALRTPEELAPRDRPLCSPDWRETGKLYDFPRTSHEFRPARLSAAGRPSVLRR